MEINRRDALTLAASGLAAGALSALPFAPALGHGRIKALAFDAFPVFDPRPIFGLVNELFPERGKALSELWRTRQFEYTWLRTSAGRYRDFWAVTEDALVYAATKLGLDMPDETRARIMQAYLDLKAWPDAPAALRALRDAGLRLGFLSNFTPKMLNSAISSAGLDGVFDDILSTDNARTFKPDPRAYQLGIDAWNVTREEVLFVPFAAWDAAGAKWFGYPTFWVNRINMPAERLAPAVDGAGRTLTDLVNYVHSRG